MRKIPDCRSNYSLIVIVRPRVTVIVIISYKNYNYSSLKRLSSSNG